MKISILSIALFIAYSTVQAQQDPLYAQYFNNPMLINPAFAGSNERLYAGLAYRAQWTGIEGGPATFNFNSHMSIVDNRVGVGIIAVQDKIGEIKNAQYTASFAYRLKLNSSMFSFGMQAGALQYTANMEGVRVNNPDPLFAPYSQTNFNLGAGLLLKNDVYTVGLSVPNLMAGKAELNGQDLQMYGRNYYLFGSYQFFVSERIAFRPSTLLRFTDGSSPSVDINANFIFNRFYTAGLLTRNLNTYGVLLQGVFKNARLGYVFELPGKAAALQYPTHEVSLAISLDVLSNHNHSFTGL